MPELQLIGDVATADVQLDTGMRVAAEHDALYSQRASVWMLFGLALAQAEDGPDYSVLLPPISKSNILRT